MILHMMRTKADGSIQLAKVGASKARKIYKKRGYVEIDSEEWKRRHAEWRKEKLGEVEAVG